MEEVSQEEEEDLARGELTRGLCVGEGFVCDCFNVSSEVERCRADLFPETGISLLLTGELLAGSFGGGGDNASFLGALSRYEEGTQPSLSPISTYHHPLAFFVTTVIEHPAEKLSPSLVPGAWKSARVTYTSSSGSGMTSYTGQGSSTGSELDPVLVTVGAEGLGGGTRRSIFL